MQPNDAGDVLTYSLDNTGAMSFDINRATGQLTTKADLDFETGPTYTVTVTATDPFGAMDTSQVEITVSEVNEAPVLSGGAASMDRAENGTDLDEDATNNDQFTVTDEDTVDNAAVLRWSLSGADADKFQIGTTGGVTRTLSFKQAPAVPFLPDYEAPGDSGADNLYEVTVVVTDTKGNSDEQDVTVKVTNVEEPGTIMLSTLQPRVGFPVTAMLTDADNITAGSVSWQWYKGTVTQELLDTLDDRECVAATTNECFIKGATSATYTPVANDVNDTLLAVALYTDGSPNQDDAEDFAMMATATTVLADTRNKAPVFPDQDLEMDGDQTDQERSVLENTTANMPIGTTNNGSVTPDPVTALDSITTNIGGMTDEVLTYSLGGPDAASFSIDRSTAVLSTKAALDKETKDTYTVTVTATDPSGLTATITVTIKVTNEDEAPEIMLGGLGIDGMRSVRYAENGTDAVATYTAVGPESASTTWALSGDDAGDFDISGSGVLTFRSFPDYEAPRDADTNNEYKVTVQADDGTYMDTLNVTVTVTDEDEAPMMISGSGNMEYAENDTRVVETYMVTGSNAGSATWSLEGADDGDFTIIDGELRFSNSPDYEMATDADTDNVYMVTVKASDGTDMATHEVTVTVTDVDEVPTIAGDATIDYAENGTGDVATYTAMDPEEATITWSLSGTDAGVFDISGAGVLTFKESPDYEMSADADTDNTYMVTVEATAGADMDTQDVVITVTDVVEMAPEMSLLDRYDTDGNDQIDKSEVIEAINDYLFGVGDEQITKEQVITIINLYLFG